MQKLINDIFEALREKWHPGFTRPLADQASGGLISPKTLANLASRREGPPFELIRGRAFYPAESFYAWLRDWARGGE